jgi:prepilin-type N-terminal cleavage/methylation domain-containing protein
MKYARHSDERGFTLIELLVVTVIMVVASLFSLIFLLTPEDYGPQKVNGERRAELAYIASGIKRYAADNGQLPPDMPTKTTAIGSYEDHYDLCTYLVPKYMKDIPGDPQGGIRVGDGSCDKEGVKHATGYAIILEKDGSVTVSAPFSELEGLAAPEITIKP